MPSGPNRWLFDVWSRVYDLTLVQRLSYRPEQDVVLRHLGGRTPRRADCSEFRSASRSSRRSRRGDGTVSCHRASDDAADRVGGKRVAMSFAGLAPATLGEPEVTPTPGLLGRDDARFVADRLFGGDIERALRGHAAFGTFRRGRGEVFTAGTTEWAWRLAAGDPFIDRITRNVLTRGERDPA